jgi:hypothetical protein
MANDISNTDNIIDARDVQKRIDELQDDGDTKPWVAGWNLPGHSPDTPYEPFSTWKEAQDYLIDELERSLDNKLPDDISLIDRDQINGMYQRVIDEIRDSQEAAGMITVGIDGWVFCVEPNDGFDPELLYELEQLKSFAAEIDDSKLRHGETLIREDHFEDYARELAEDLEGEAMRKASWPFNCIDWERAARELQQDYSTADYDGVTYYYRS